jgi:phosphoserine phosphatase
VSYRLLMMDVDSTLINEEVIDLLASYAGAGEKVAAITESAMRGEIDFATALRQRLILLKGQPVSILKDVRSQISFTSGALELLKLLKNQGWRIGLVSGGFLEILEPLCEELDLDLIHAHRLSIESDFLTGEIVGTVVDKDEKARALRQFAEAYQIDLRECVAIGDGANDIEMIKLAGLGISFCGKPALSTVADAHITERNLMKVVELLKT